MNVDRQRTTSRARTCVVALMLLASIFTRCSVTRIAAPTAQAAMPVVVEVVDVCVVGR